MNKKFVSLLIIIFINCFLVTNIFLRIEKQDLPPNFFEELEEALEKLEKQETKKGKPAMPQKPAVTKELPAIKKEVKSVADTRLLTDLWNGIGSLNTEAQAKIKGFFGEEYLNKIKPHIKKANEFLVEVMELDSLETYKSAIQEKKDVVKEINKTLNSITKILDDVDDVAKFIKETKKKNPKKKITEEYILNELRKEKTKRTIEFPTLPEKKQHDVEHIKENLEAFYKSLPNLKKEFKAIKDDPKIKAQIENERKKNKSKKITDHKKYYRPSSDYNRRSRYPNYREGGRGWYDRDGDGYSPYRNGYQPSKKEPSKVKSEKTTTKDKDDAGYGYGRKAAKEEKAKKEEKTPEDINLTTLYNEASELILQICRPIKEVRSIIDKKIIKALKNEAIQTLASRIKAIQEKKKAIKDPKKQPTGSENKFYSTYMANIKPLTYLVKHGYAELFENDAGVYYLVTKSKESIKSGSLAIVGQVNISSANGIIKGMLPKALHSEAKRKETDILNIITKQIKEGLPKSLKKFKSAKNSIPKDNKTTILHIPPKNSISVTNNLLNSLRFMISAKQGPSPIKTKELKINDFIGDFKDQEKLSKAYDPTLQKLLFDVQKERAQKISGIEADIDKNEITQILTEYNKYLQKQASVSISGIPNFENFTAQHIYNDVQDSDFHRAIQNTTRDSGRISSGRKKIADSYKTHLQCIFTTMNIDEYKKQLDILSKIRELTGLWKVTKEKVDKIEVIHAFYGKITKVEVPGYPGTKKATIELEPYTITPRKRKWQEKIDVATARAGTDAFTTLTAFSTKLKANFEAVTTKSVGTERNKNKLVLVFKHENKTYVTIPFNQDGAVHFEEYITTGGRTGTTYEVEEVEIKHKSDIKFLAK